MADKYVTNIGPGNTIGAMAVGNGAKAHGSVTVGGQPKPASERIRMTIDIRGAESREQIAEWLKKIRKDILDDGDSGAIGDVTGAKPSGAAWRIESEQG